MKSNKKVVRLTESKLREMIAEAVNETLNEYGETDYGQYMLGRLAVRKGEKFGEDEPINDYAEAARERSGSRWNPFLAGRKHQKLFQAAVDDSNKSEIKNYRDIIKNNAQEYYDQTPWGAKELAKQKEQENRKKYRLDNFSDDE